MAAESSRFAVSVRIDRTSTPNPFSLCRAAIMESTAEEGLLTRNLMVAPPSETAAPPLRIAAPLLSLAALSSWLRF